MSQSSGNIHDFGMDTVSMAGALSHKLQAMRDAGFAQVMLGAHELVAHAQGLVAAVDLVRNSGLRVTALKALTDFEGFTHEEHQYKIDVAKSMLETCAALGCSRLLVQASTRKDASTTPSVLAKDLRKLAMMAVPMNIKIVFSGSLSAASARDFLLAWDLVCEADMPNLGLGLGADTLDMLRADNALEDLDMLDPDKLFLVQIADRLGGDTAQAVFPGEGVHARALAAQVKCLHDLGYRGDYSFDVDNRDYQQMALATVAQRARRAALWLGETVLQRSVPLPNHIRLRRVGVA